LKNRDWCALAGHTPRAPAAGRKHGRRPRTLLHWKAHPQWPEYGRTPACATRRATNFT